MRCFLVVFLFMVAASGSPAAQGLTPSATNAPASGGASKPRPSVGVALGLFGEVDQTPANDNNPIVAGTMEIPYSRHERIRIEAGRTRFPLLPYGATDDANRTDTAHITHLTVGLAGVREPGAPVSGYLGTGFGIYRASFDRTPDAPMRFGVHVYGGAELQLSHRVTLDAELGVHLLPAPLYARSVLSGETIIRLKFAM
jgi:hypothetical protein